MPRPGETVLGHGFATIPRGKGANQAVVALVRPGASRACCAGHLPSLSVTWEWLPGAAVGVAGIVGGAWIASRGRKQDRRMATARFEHEQKVAHAQWYRERRADAYVQLLLMAEAVGQWASFVQPLMSSAGDPTPELPALAEQAPVEARVRAFGSERVKELLAAWRAVVWELIRADHAVRLAERSIEKSGRTSIDDAAERRKIGVELRPAEQRLRNELAQAIAEELNEV